MEVNMFEIGYFEWLEWAIEQIKAGCCNKLEKYNTTVYRCGTVVRVDIKRCFDDYK